MITKSKVIKAISLKHNIPKEYIDLMKLEGEYFLSGKLGCSLTQSSLGYLTLKNNTVEDFMKEVDYVLNMFEEDDIVSYIESIDWAVE